MRRLWRNARVPRGTRLETRRHRPDSTNRSATRIAPDRNRICATSYDHRRDIDRGCRIARHHRRCIHQRAPGIDLRITSILLCGPNGRRSRFDLDVRHAPVHQPARRMEVRSVGELALDRLDRVHQLVALADADDLPARLGHADVGERVDEFAIRPLAVERDAGEQSGLVDAIDDRDDLRYVLKLVIDDGQLVIGGKALKRRSDRLPPLQHPLMAPGMRPAEPTFRLTFAAEHCQTEEVVEPAAVDADDNGLAALEQRIEIKTIVLRPEPELGAGPAIRSQSDTDLDIEMLRRPNSHGVLTL